MATHEDGAEDNPDATGQWLNGVLGGLDDETYNATAYPSFNALMSLYQQLPEHRMAATIGSIVCIVFEDEYMEVMPVAAFGDFVIARDFEVPLEEQDVPEYLMLGGSVLLDEVYVVSHGSDELVPTIAQKISAGKKSDTYIPEVDTGFVYRPAVFCHSARLAIARAYGMHELQQTHMKRKTRQTPMVGTIVTVGIGGKDTVLFVEEPFTLTDPIRQVEVKVDDEAIPVLTYVDDEC